MKFSKKYRKNNPRYVTADKWFQRYCRLRDANEHGYCQCISCGEYRHWKGMDGGHFITKAKLNTRYNEMNCHAQCRKCNRFTEGNQAEYEKAMINKYGQDKVNMLKIQSKKVIKLCDLEIKTVSNYYRKRCYELEKKLC